MTDSINAADALASEWDERYTSLAEKIPDGKPSGVLTTAVEHLVPGRALDIGCGVGADAIWLAGRGWTVTALDVSQVALDRAAARSRAAGIHVEWVCTRLEDAQLPARGFHLVVAHYPALRQSPGHEAEKALLAAVAPGGALLVVHHANIDPEMARSHGFDIADFVSHEDIVEMLGDDWDVRMERQRPRDEPTGPEGQHTHDDVVHARRRGVAE
ncbi:methyltransferase [Mycolicibacterium cyprinidarum]|uniref:Methyltransferase n=1 Tax=Mycolicibacterium cyprinidarum TaxID=2860311 RepID=A0ABQ4V995_9MYCO|nr:methyltransferase [Mycolicibacterium sp. NGTWSNA01]GJF15178.1 methyltransferase [Mycolicibacterium sp. NGTWS0302]